MSINYTYYISCKMSFQWEQTISKHLYRHIYVYILVLHKLVNINNIMFCFKHQNIPTSEHFHFKTGIISLGIVTIIWSYTYGYIQYIYIYHLNCNMILWINLDNFLNSTTFWVDIKEQKTWIFGLLWIIFFIHFVLRSLKKEQFKI